MRIRPAFLVLLAFCCAWPAAAQTQTAVSATVKDPNGIPYSNGTFSIQLIPSGTNPSVNGAAIQGAFNGALDVNGSFSVSLWPNGSITPASTQWQFTVCSNSGGIQPPLGTGTQCTPPTAVTISGSAQVLSTTLSNVAPKLTNFAGAGTGTIGGTVSATHIPFASSSNTLADIAGSAVIPATGAISLTAGADTTTPFSVAAHSSTQSANIADFNMASATPGLGAINFRGRGLGNWSAGGGPILAHFMADGNSPVGWMVSNNQSGYRGNGSPLGAISAFCNGVTAICTLNGGGNDANGNYAPIIFDAAGKGITISNSDNNNNISAILTVETAQTTTHHDIQQWQNACATTCVTTSGIDQFGNAYWNGTTSGKAGIGAQATAGTPCFIDLPAASPGAANEFLITAAATGSGPATCATSWTNTITAPATSATPLTVAGISSQTATLVDINNQSTGGGGTGTLAAPLLVEGIGLGAFNPSGVNTVVAIQQESDATTGTGLIITNKQAVSSSSRTSTMEFRVPNNGIGQLCGGNAVGDGNGDYPCLTFDGNPSIYGSTSHPGNLGVLVYLNGGTASQVPLTIYNQNANATGDLLDLVSAASFPFVPNSPVDFVDKIGKVSLGNTSLPPGTGGPSDIGFQAYGMSGGAPLTVTSNGNTGGSVLTEGGTGSNGGATSGNGGPGGEAVFSSGIGGNATTQGNGANGGEYLAGAGTGGNGAGTGGGGAGGLTVIGPGPAGNQGGNAGASAGNGGAGGIVTIAAGAGGQAPAGTSGAGGIINLNVSGSQTTSTLTPGAPGQIKLTRAVGALGTTAMVLTTDNWSTTGTISLATFNAATDAGPANAASKLLDLQLLGASQFSVTKNGIANWVDAATNTNCSAVGTAASPSVASCGAASAGQFSCATNATGATCQVNTTAVTANSEIFVLESDTTTTATRLGVTCNTTTTVNPATRLLASSVAGTSFTINLGTVTTNPACFSYFIIN